MKRDVRKKSLAALDEQVLGVEIAVMAKAHSDYVDGGEARNGELALKAADRIARHRGLNAAEKKDITLSGDYERYLAAFRAAEREGQAASSDQNDAKKGTS